MFTPDKIDKLIEDLIFEFYNKTIGENTYKKKDIRPYLLVEIPAIKRAILRTLEKAQQNNDISST